MEIFTETNWTFIRECDFIVSPCISCMYEWIVCTVQYVCATNESLTQNLILYISLHSHTRMTVCIVQYWRLVYPTIEVDRNPYENARKFSLCSMNRIIRAKSLLKHAVLCRISLTFQTKALHRIPSFCSQDICDIFCSSVLLWSSPSFPLLLRGALRLFLGVVFSSIRFECYSTMHSRAYSESSINPKLIERRIAIYKFNFNFVASKVKANRTKN